MSDSLLPPWTVACQAPQSRGLFRKEYWKGLQCSPPGDFPHPGIEPASLSSPALAVGSVPLAPPREARGINVNICLLLSTYIGLPRWLGGKESTCQAEYAGLIAQMGRSPGEGHGNPLQYSCLGNSMDRCTWRATVYRIAQSDMTEATEHTHKHSHEQFPIIEDIKKYKCHNWWLHVVIAEDLTTPSWQSHGNVCKSIKEWSVKRENTWIIGNLITSELNLVIEIKFHLHIYIYICIHTHTHLYEHNDLNKTVTEQFIYILQL